MSRFFSKFFGSLRKAHAVGFRPAFETLESRWCPSTVRFNGNTSALTIAGTPGPDAVSIVQNDASNRIAVSHDGIVEFFASDKVKTISIDLGSGDDRLTYELSSDLTQAKTIGIGLGTGHDRATLDFGKMKSHAVKADLSLKVAGGDGNDTVRADFGNQEGKALAVNIAMGNGSDSAETYLWGILRGTKATISQRGEAGDDVLRFYNDNGAWASSSLKVGLEGGDGNDLLSLFYDDAVICPTELGASGGKGNDTLTAQVNTRAAASSGSMYVKLLGDEGNDFMSLKMDEVFGTVRTSFAGGAGNDIVRAEYGLPFGVGNLESTKLNVHLDGGDGDDTAEVKVLGVLRGNTDARFEMYGRKGNDALRFYNDNGSHAGAKLDVLMQGNEGNDTLTTFFDDAASGKYRFYVDGGAGNDTVQAEMHLRSGIVSGAMDVILVGGSEDDRLSFKADQLSTNLYLQILGGTGKDIAQADFGLPFGAGNIENARTGVYMNLGDQDDEGTLNIWGVLRGTEFTARMEGGQGNDRLRFYNDNGSWSSTRLRVALDGGADNDLVSLVFDDNIIGTYFFDLNGGTGDDRVEAVVNARSGSTGTLEVLARGDAGRDLMRLEVHDDSAGRLRLPRVVVDGGTEWDALLAATSNVRVVNIP